MYNLSIYGGGRLCQSFLKGLNQKTNIKIYLYNRTQDKYKQLKNIYPNIQFKNKLNAIVKKQSFAFLIIPSDVILNLNKDFLDKVIETNSILVSFANGLSLETLNKKYRGIKIIRILPNINWQILKGFTLLQKNESVEENDLKELNKILNLVTDIYNVEDEDEFDTLGTLSTCGPGIMTQLFLEISKSFHLRNKKQFRNFIRSCKGSLELLEKNNPEKIIDEVAIKGGLTEKGVNAIKKAFPKCGEFVYEEMKSKIDQRKKALSSEKAF